MKTPIFCGARSGLRQVLSKNMMIAALILIPLGLTACGSESEETGGQQAQAMPVSVMEVTPEDLQIYRDYPSRISGARQVEIRARVEGILEERLYEEGQNVEQDQPLFRIDPKSFEVAVMTAEAERDTAKADLEQAARVWERSQRLFAQDAISERERDQAQATHDLAEARLAAAEARLAQAQISLDYTTVTAPVFGVTSLEVLAEGSLVEPGTLLTEIIQNDPVHVRFSLPEEDTLTPPQGKREAQLILGNGEAYDITGIVDFTASTIDPRTGTTQARAIFDNPDGRLIPGQFARVRLMTEALENVITVPNTAIGQNRSGARVFVVDDENIAHERSIELGPLADKRRAILSGLTAGEKVVTSGQVALSDGAEVQHENPAENTETAPDAETEQTAPPAAEDDSDQTEEIED